MNVEARRVLQERLDVLAIDIADFDNSIAQHEAALENQRQHRDKAIRERDALLVALGVPVAAR